MFRGRKRKDFLDKTCSRYVCKFGKNPLTDSQDITQTMSQANVDANADADANGIGICTNKSCRRTV